MGVERHGWWYHASTQNQAEKGPENVSPSYIRLEVNNRPGVAAILAGCALIVIGTLWISYFRIRLLGRR